MSLNRGQVFKPLGYQSVYSANKIPITNDPLVKLTLLIINYCKNQNLIDILTLFICLSNFDEN